jgi:hypothetical protein
VAPRVSHIMPRGARAPDRGLGAAIRAVTGLPHVIFRR